MAVTALLAGCGGGSGDAVGVAGDWYRAVTGGDAAAACRVMEPTAVQALREKYVAAPATAPCEEVVRGYAAEVDRGKARVILDGGFEAGDPTPSGELGVFPAAQAYEFEIVLMREVDDEWRVISVNLPPA